MLTSRPLVPARSIPVLDERHERKRQQLLARRKGGKIQWRPERVGQLEDEPAIDDDEKENEGAVVSTAPEKEKQQKWFCAVACGEAHRSVSIAFQP